MKKALSFVIAALLLAGIAPLFAQNADVSGNWEITLDINGTEIVRPYTFELTGEKLVVKWTRKNGEKEQAEGTVKGDKIQWTEKGNINGEDVEILWNGTIKGDTMSGEQEFQEATFSWKAVKKG